MENLGSLIYSLRIKNNMSASKLSEGICSKKYIYMIENSERYPSVEILHKIFQRLKFDYFKYLQYINFPNALEVTRLVTQLDQYREFGNYNGMAELLPKLEAINEGALDLQVAYNRLLLRAVDHDSYDGVLKEAYEALGIEDFTAFDRGRIGDYALYELYLYNLVSRALYKKGQTEAAMYILTHIHDYFSESDPYQEFNQFIVDNTITYALVLREEGRYEDALDELEKCIKQQTYSMISHKRHQIYYLTARCYSDLHQYDKAREMIVVATYLCQQVDNTRFLLRVNKLSETIEVMERRSESRNSNIVLLDRREIVLESGGAVTTVQLYQPDVVHVAFGSFSLRLVEEVMKAVNDMMEDHMKDVKAFHMIYDVRKLLVDSFRVHFQTLNVHGFALQRHRKGRKSIIRLENELALSSTTIDLFFVPFEDVRPDEPLLFRGKATSINQAMGIINAIG